MNTLSSVDFLKMDCEGAEYEIIKKTPKNILSKIKFIALEYHLKEQYACLPNSPLELIKKLEEAGFSVKIFNHQIIHAKNKNA